MFWLNCWQMSLKLGQKGQNGSDFIIADDSNFLTTGFQNRTNLMINILTLR